MTHAVPAIVVRRGTQPTGVSLERGIRVATPTYRATERTTSQSYRRTPTSIATYSVSRNPEIIAPPESPRCEVHAGSSAIAVSHQYQPHNVRSVTSALSEGVQLSHQHGDAPTQIYHPVNRISLFGAQFLQLKELRLCHQGPKGIVDGVLKR